MDFLCADSDGYRDLRSALTDSGTRALFDPTVETVRPFVADQYGIRAILAVAGQHLRFEIVREGRIALSGAIDSDLGVPTLAVDDQFAEKLLANSDRCLDRAVACRDAIDLGFLARANGGIPTAAIIKAEKAYGHDIVRKVGLVLDQLALLDVRVRCAESLQMTVGEVATAASALGQAAVAAWPRYVFAASNPR